MEATLHDVILDLAQILNEAADSGRLVGGENVRIESIDTDAYIGNRVDRLVLTLSDGTKADIHVTLDYGD